MLFTRPLLSPWIPTSPFSGSNILYWATLPHHKCHSYWTWAVIYYSVPLWSERLCWYLSCSALANSLWTKEKGDERGRRRGEGRERRRRRKEKGREGKGNTGSGFWQSLLRPRNKPRDIIHIFLFFFFKRYSFFEQFEHFANISVFCAFLRVLERFILCKQLFSMIPPGSSSIFIALEFTTTYNLYMHSSSKNAKIKSF